LVTIASVSSASRISLTQLTLATPVCQNWYPETVSTSAPYSVAIWP
jgi:hypothetical protein